MRSRYVAAAVLGLGTGCGGPASCELRDVVAARGDGAHLTSCGTTPDTTTHDCVVAALAAHQEFVVQWDILGLDSQIGRAYMGRVEGGAYVLYRFDFEDSHGSGADANPSTVTDRCSALTDLGACANLADTLCFECDATAGGSTCP